MGVRMVEFGKRRKEERRDIFCLGKKKKPNKTRMEQVGM